MVESVIAGIDNQSNVRIEVNIQGLYKKISYGAVLDTGFSGGIVLPLVSAVDIGLEKAGAANITLADGTIKTLPTFLCKVTIGGRTQDATTLIMGNDVLIGMELISNYQVCIAPYSGKVDIAHSSDVQSIQMLGESLRRVAGGI